MLDPYCVLCGHPRSFHQWVKRAKTSILGWLFGPSFDHGPPASGPCQFSLTPLLPPARGCSCGSYVGPAGEVA